MADIELLKRLAEAATPGPWVVDPLDIGARFNIESADGKNAIAMAQEQWGDKANVQRMKNADFIAAANPAAILELIAENERLRMQLVACGVVAMANTQESAAKARDMHPDYMSASCQDVMRAVDSEMALRAELERVRAEGLGRPALERVQSRLKAAGAVLPAPEANGTTESAMLQGLCIALCLVEEEIAAMGRGGGQNGSKTAETRASAGLDGGGHGGSSGGAENALETVETREIDGAEGGAEKGGKADD